MKRLVKLSILFIAIVLAGCAAQSQEILPARSIYAISPISALSMSGGSNITIVLGSPVNRITAYGAPVSLSRSRDGALSISSAYYFHSPTKVLVEVRRLSQIDLSDFANVFIKSRYPQTINLHLENIDNVQIKGSITIREFRPEGIDKLLFGNKTRVKFLNLSGETGKDEFHGSVDTANISLDGSQKINLFILRNRKLVVNGTDNSFIKLSGSTRNLDVNLDNSSELDAKFLRAKTAHVTTQDNAYASIYAMNYLFAETDGPSSIYYFGNPKYIYKANSGQGVILPGDPKAMQTIPERG